MRQFMFSGGFYPSEKSEIESLIESFPKAKKRNVLGLVVPHAGYVYSGKTASLGYSSVKSGFETVILFGINHNALGSVGVSADRWRTPLGVLEPDSELINVLTKDSQIKIDEKSQMMEHSIEVQLPFLQYFFKGFRIVPISINPYYFDVETCRQIGESAAKAVEALGRKVLLIASSDFTHYGAMYGTESHEGTAQKIVEKVKNGDMKAIEKILQLKPAEVIELGKDSSICGYGAIASMLFAAKQIGAKKAELIDYSTSFDVSKNIDAVVGYASIAVF